MRRKVYILSSDRLPSKFVRGRAGWRRCPIIPLLLGKRFQIGLGCMLSIQKVSLFYSMQEKFIPFQFIFPLFTYLIREEDEET